MLSARPKTPVRRELPGVTVCDSLRRALRRVSTSQRLRRDPTGVVCRNGHPVRGLLDVLQRVACKTRGWGARALAWSRSVAAKCRGGGGGSASRLKHGRAVGCAVHHVLQRAVASLDYGRRIERRRSKASLAERIAVRVLAEVMHSRGWAPILGEYPVCVRGGHGRPVATCVDGVFCNKRGRPCLVEWKVGQGPAYRTPIPGLTLCNGEPLSMARFHMCQLACAAAMFEATTGLKCHRRDALLVRATYEPAARNAVEQIPVDQDIWKMRRALVDALVATK